MTRTLRSNETQQCCNKDLEKISDMIACREKTESNKYKHIKNGIKSGMEWGLRTNLMVKGKNKNTPKKYSPQTSCQAVHVLKRILLDLIVVLDRTKYCI